MIKTTGESVSKIQDPCVNSRWNVCKVNLVKCTSSILSKPPCHMLLNKISKVSSVTIFNGVDNSYKCMSSINVTINEVVRRSITQTFAKIFL